MKKNVVEGLCVLAILSALFTFLFWFREISLRGTIIPAEHYRDFGGLFYMFFQGLTGGAFLVGLFAGKLARNFEIEDGRKKIFSSVVFLSSSFSFLLMLIAYSCGNVFREMLK